MSAEWGVVFRSARVWVPERIDSAGRALTEADVRELLADFAKATGGALVTREAGGEWRSA